MPRHSESSGGSRRREGTSSSHRGPEPGEAYGAAGLTQHLHGVDFPISKQDLLDQFGDAEFKWTKDGAPLKLRDYLQDVPEEIRNITEITEAVSETNRQRSSRR